MSEDQVVVPGYASITYPTSVKLKQTGCQIIPFKYVTDENLSRENTVFIVAITPQNSKRGFGFAAWLSSQTSMGEKALPAMARIGTLEVKVCRKPHLYSPQAKAKTPGISPGVYRIIFDASATDPITGNLVGEKVEIIRMIKFY